MAMVKLVFMGFGHIDVSLPLLKYLDHYHDCTIDYYIILSKQYPYDSVLNIGDLNLEPDLYTPERAKDILPDWMYRYFAGRINIYLCLYPSIKPWSIKSHRYFSRVIKHLQKKKYDLLHLSGTNLFMFRLIYSFRLRNLKKVFSIHDWENHSGERSKLKLAERVHRFLAATQPLIMQNKKDFESAKTLNRQNKKIFYCPFGLLDFYHLFDSIPAPASDILFFGRISKYKGLAVLLCSFKDMIDRDKKLVLCIAGKGAIDYPVEEIPPDNLVVLNRYIDDAELASLLRKTKIVVCPYTDATQSAVLVTAQTFNRVVIASAVGGFKDILSDGITGFLVPPNDSRALAEKMEQVLQDDQYKLLEPNVKLYYESGSFSWKTITTTMFEIYNNILGRL